MEPSKTCVRLPRLPACGSSPWEMIWTLVFARSGGRLGKISPISRTLPGVSIRCGRLQQMEATALTESFREIPRVQYTLTHNGQRFSGNDACLSSKRCVRSVIRG